MPWLINHHWKVLLIIVVSGFIVFANGLHGPMMIDDYVVFDERTRNIDNLKYQFLPNRNEVMQVSGKQDDVFFRPLALAIPMICYSFFHEQFVFYHVFNLLLWCMAVFLLYRFIDTVFKDRVLALLVALLFLAHPLNGIVVNYITASVFIVELMALTAGLWLLARGREVVKNKIIVFCLLVTALMCHETAMLFPFFCAWFLWVVDKKSSREILLKTGWLFLVVGLYFSWRLNHASLNDSIFKSFVHLNMSIDAYLASLVKITSWYFSKIFYPQGITIMWNAKPMHGLLVAGWLAAGVLILIFLLWLVYYFRRQQVIVFGLGIFFIGFLLLPFASVFQPIDGLTIEPHWFIFPLMGAVLAIVGALYIWWRIKTVLIVLMLIPLMIASWQHNYLWANERRYCEFWYKQAPDLNIVKTFLARIYLTHGEIDKARFYYLDSLTNTYSDHLFYANLGVIALMKNDVQTAKNYFNRALIIEPRATTALNNLGLIAQQGGDINLAKQYFLKAMAANKLDINSRYNMAKLLEKNKEIDAAKRLYESILNINPRHEPSLTDLGFLYMQVSNWSKATKIFKSVLEINPRATIALNNLGVIALVLNNPEEAKKYFLKALTIDPHSNLARLNLNAINKPKINQ